MTVNLTLKFGPFSRKILLKKSPFQTYWSKFIEPPTMTENNNRMELLLLVEGFGGSDDHPPPLTTTLFPTTTTTYLINLQEQGNTSKSIPTALFHLLPNIPQPFHILFYLHHLPNQLQHYHVCYIHGCKFKVLHFNNTIVRFFSRFVWFREIKCCGRWFP